MKSASRRVLQILLVHLLMSSAHATEPALKNASPETGASSESASQGAPSIRLPETIFDFGEAVEGAEVAHRFVVKNTGNEALRIEDVQPDCGCTAAQFDRIIPAAGEGAITLKLNLKGYRGSVQKIATVHCNDPRQPRIKLTLQGTVKMLIDVRPPDGVSFRGPPERQSERVVDLAAAGEPFHILKVESSLDDKIAYKVETVEDGRKYRLRLSNVSKQGAYHGIVKIHTDFAKKPEVVIRVYGSIEGDIAVRPQTILVGALHAGQPPQQGRIVVIDNRGKSFRITKLSYDERLIKVTTAPLEKEPGYVLEITPVMENIPPGSRRQIVLTVETDATPSMKYDIQVRLIHALDSPSLGESS